MPLGQHNRKNWWGLAVITGAQLMVTLDASVVTIALPSMQHSVGLTVADRQCVVTGYTLACCCSAAASATSWAAAAPSSPA